METAPPFKDAVIGSRVGYEPLKHIGLFEGIGGFSLAAAWANWETTAWCEWDSFCQHILSYHFPKAKKHHDITKTDFTIYRGHINVLTGGFPCQGFSVAGSRLGVEDDRYLWPEMRRAYKEIQPDIIIGENVTGILSMEDTSGIYRDVFAKVESRIITKICEIDKYEAIYTRQAKMLVDSICNDLETDGYEVQPFVIPAASVQAPHRRDRIWFIAYRNGFRNEAGRSGRDLEKKDQAEWADLFEQSFGFGKKRNATHADRPGCQERHLSQKPINQRFTDGGDYASAGILPDATSIGLRGKIYGSGKSGFNGEIGARTDWRNFPTESPVLFGDDGLSAKLDGITFSQLRRQSLKGSGNAIVPNVAFEFCNAINAQRKLTNDS
ncbi:MAG TPA: DNA cytosine methyltransferase [Flavobacterium sp.]|jgi:DNA (cytosine-5)-methyltransferase 1